MRKFFKRLIATIIILTIASTAFFFIGWAQFKLKNDCFGIVISKSSGVSKDIIKRGEFNWKWEFLVPTNARMENFSLQDITCKKQVEGILPSSELYSKAIETNNPFSYKMIFSAKVHVSQEKVLELINNGKIINQNDLIKYAESQVDKLCTQAAVSLLSKKINQDNFIPSIKDINEVFESFEATQKQKDIEITDFILMEYQLPDYKLYTATRDYYLKALYSIIHADLTKAELSPEKIVNNMKEINSDFKQKNEN